MKTLVSAVVSLLVFAAPGPVLAWGAQGHQFVGGLADGLLNPHAKAQVNSILGYDLRTAATWPDCVRSVAHTGGKFVLYRDPKHPEYLATCKAFTNSTTETARMEDYVGRNWFNCDGHGKGCHTTYHFADIDTAQDHYDPTFVGAGRHDIVATLDAAVAMLKDQPLPPFYGPQPAPHPGPQLIKDKKEALLLIAHLVGDLHQPLHVGAVYLDAQGHPLQLEPTDHALEAGATTGGNSIKDGGGNLHSDWDGLSPISVTKARRAQIAAVAAQVAPTPGPPALWPAAWATDAVVRSHEAFADLTYGARAGGKWPAVFADRTAYFKAKTTLQEAQLAKGGARLAELLNEVWP